MSTVTSALPPLLAFSTPSPLSSLISFYTSPLSLHSSLSFYTNCLHFLQASLYFESCPLSASLTAVMTSADNPARTSSVFLCRRTSPATLLIMMLGSILIDVGFS
eukprot:GILI01002691.1.p1 GENE.GILI01002691.1~~GILI01002691.1.p1  ORF type:complete len:105 (-),score=11.64 GILI01002691.1:304-618(-)